MPRLSTIIKDDYDFANPHNNDHDHHIILFIALISLCLIVLVVMLHLSARCLIRRQTRRRAALTQLSLTVIIQEPPKTGLDPAIIATIPIFPFKQTNDETGQPECSVCLSVLDNDDMVRMLPNCTHKFHVECIDKWFLSDSTCPVCRSQVEPQLLVTVVDTAQHLVPPVDRVNSM